MAQKYTVLIVDDTPDNIALLSGLLRDQYRIKVATGGEKALQIAATSPPPDLVLLDVMMPGMDGYEVCARLKADAGTADIPVIFLTARSDTEDERKGLESGAVDYITKPISPPIVEARIRTQLALVESRREAERQRDFVRKMFGRYMDDRLVDRVLEGEGAPDLVGERARVTILMSDLRGFTSLAEAVRPEDALSMLNTYLGYMLRIISEHDGTIDNIIGDGILVVFGTPQPAQDDARRAVGCALAMQAAMPEINHELERRGLPILAMGIGINSGDVIVGNVGSEAHMKYSVIGSPVNLAARIESLTFGGQVLVSATTYNEVREHFPSNGHLRVKVKGVEDPIHIFDVSALPSA